MKYALAVIILNMTAPLQGAAEEDVASPPAQEVLIPFETLMERSIGLVKRPAIFEWRKARLMLGITGGQPVEYNNFNVSATSLDLRLPLGSFCYRMSLGHVIVKDSDSSRQLRESPYFQSGRPGRWEWRHAMEFPLHEGIGSQVSSTIAPTEFVVSAVADFGISLYPGDGLGFLTNMAKLKLTGAEHETLEKQAPESMRISSARHDIGFGLQWDNYFANGFHWSFRTLLHRAPAAGSGDLAQWLSFSAGVGYAL